MTDQATGLPEGAAPSAEYVQQMTSAVHGDPTPAQHKTPEAPTVPDKFKSPDGSVNTEALLRSYAELERKLSAPSATQETPPAAPEAKPDAAPEANPGAKIERPEGEAPAAEATPLTTAIEAIKTAYEGGQDLSDDLIEPLTKAGLPREMIDTYFAGLRAIEASIELSAHEAAGGKDKFEAARSWAATALTDQELDYYNTQAASPATAKQAVEWLMAKHGAANPSEGRTVDAEPTNGAGAGDVFASQHELTKAISSVEYKTNPAFRQAVAEKLQRSIRSGSMRALAEFHAG